MVPLARRPERRPVMRAGRDTYQPVHAQRQKAATRALPRRSNVFRVSTWFRLLWGMALLGLLFLPSSYRAGAESAHAHSLVQLWEDASDGKVHHHADGGLSGPGPDPSTSWFDPAVAETGRTGSVGLDDRDPDIAEQHDSAPAASGVHLLMTAITAIVPLEMGEAPVTVPDRRRTGLSPRVLLPPPRWTPAA